MSHSRIVMFSQSPVLKFQVYPFKEEEKKKKKKKYVEHCLRHFVFIRRLQYVKFVKEEKTALQKQDTWSASEYVREKRKVSK